MKEERNRKDKKYLEVIFKFYTERKLLIAVFAVVMYVVFSVIVNNWVRNSADLLLETEYHICVALQNVSITVFSVFFLDFLISGLYEQQLKKSVADILTNPDLTRNFIKDECEEKILKCSMDAILGERVSRKITENILQNYRVMEKNCLRENVYVHIKLSEDSSSPEFFTGMFTVKFSVVGLGREQEFEIYYTDKKDDYNQYMEELSDGKRVLSFPFLMARGAPENSFEIISFKENGMVSEPSNEISCSPANRGKYIYRINNASKTETRISIKFRTKLNKRENYLFENIPCVCDRFHLSFYYADTSIKHCSCYCSGKDESLNIEESQEYVMVNLDDIVLPETFFILIWEI